MSWTTRGRRACVLSAAVCIVALHGCASRPQYLVNVDSTASFANYHTFGFFDEREPGMAAYQSVAHRHLKLAIVREMQARGLQRSEKPQLLINIHLQRREDGRDTQNASDYYDYRSGHYTWRTGVATVSGHYTDGTLNIEIFDPASRTLLWEGIAVGSISQRMYEELEATIDKVVARLFTDFPKSSPS
jgi:hypothetical protein